VHRSNGRRHGHLEATFKQDGVTTGHLPSGGIR
jgi:hypothetical protein